MNEKPNENALQKAAPKDVKQWLSSDEFKSALKSALPQHLTPERFVRISLTAMMKVPKIAQCTQASLFKVLLDCSSLGLEPDGRRAHIIPYGNVATLIIDYKGLIELAKRSGEIKMWRAEIVCENDSFDWNNGVVTHKVDWLKPRGKIRAVYSHVKNADGIDEYEVLTLDDVEHARSRSKAKNDGPWVTDYNEMAKKTAIRRHSKKLTLSPEFRDALEVDGDVYEETTTPEFTMDELMPKRASEMISASAPEPKPSNVIVMPTTQSEPAQVATKDMDPEARIGSKSITAIMEALKASGGIVTNPMLVDHIKTEYKVSGLMTLQEKHVDQVCAWIAAQRMEPGSDIDELPDFDAETGEIYDSEPPDFAQAQPQSRAAWMDKPITEAQRKRFYAISKKTGLSDEQIKDFLFRDYAIQSSKEIKVGDYESICNWIESQAQK